MKTKKMVKLSLFATISLALFVVETRIPNLVPVPGVKLGLANIITVCAVYSFAPIEVALITTVRITLGTIFCGSPLTFIYSLVGSTLSLIASILVKNVITRDKMWITSIISAIIHNVGQILTASVVMRSMAIFAYLPMLLISGTVTGLFCGLVALLIDQRLRNRD